MLIGRLTVIFCGDLKRLRYDRCTFTARHIGGLRAHLQKLLERRRLVFELVEEGRLLVSERDHRLIHALGLRECAVRFVMRLIGVRFWALVNLAGILQLQFVTALRSLSVHEVHKSLERILGKFLVGEVTGGLRRSTDRRLGHFAGLNLLRIRLHSVAVRFDAATDFGAVTLADIF